MQTQAIALESKLEPDDAEATVQSGDLCLQSVRETTLALERTFSDLLHCAKRVGKQFRLARSSTCSHT